MTEMSGVIADVSEYLSGLLKHDYINTGDVTDCDYCRYHCDLHLHSHLWVKGLSEVSE